MKKLRQELSLQLRGIRLCNKINGRSFILYNALETLLPQVSMLISAYFSGKVITALTENAPFAVSFRYALYTVSAVLLLYAVRRFASREALVRRHTAQHRFEAMLTRKALSLDFAQAESPDVAALLGKAEDNNKSYMGLSVMSWYVSSIAANAVTVAIAVSMASGMVIRRAEGPLTGILALVNSPLFGVLFVTVVLGLIALSIISDATLGKRRFPVLERRGKINAVWKYYYDRVLNENSSGEDIRIYHEKPLIYEEMRERVFDSTRTMYKTMQRLHGTYDMVSRMAIALLGVLVYLFVGLKALAGAFGAGKVAEYYGVLTQMILSFSVLSRAFITMRVNRPHLQEDLSFFDLRSAMQNGVRTVGDIDFDHVEFAFHDVSFRYPGTEPLVLDRLNLRIRSGERLAVVGRNGSGKSTMIKLLCRLYDPTEGSITVNGIDIREFDYAEYLKLFGIVFQDYSLLAFSIGENVACRSDYDEKKVWQCLETAGLRRRVEAMPQGLGQAVTKLYDKDGVDLSGGEGQKLAIARALYKDAPFVILDEPTAALDPKSESEIYARFDEMSGGRTAVYISHRMSSCRFCDRIVVFDGGRVAEQGTHDDLLRQNGAYAELWNAQAQHYAS